MEQKLKTLLWAYEQTVMRYMNIIENAKMYSPEEIKANEETQKRQNDIVAFFKEHCK